MTLVRQQIPSPNHGGTRSRNQLVIVHTSEGADNQVNLAQFLANPRSQVSYNTCFDNNGDPNVIVECVQPGLKPWAALLANDWGVHGCNATPAGASANWNRDVWMSKGVMLEKCARWIGEECARFGIPVTKVDANQIRAGQRGVCGHGDVSAAGAGGGHFDPGPQFPWDHVLTLAGGQAPTPPPDPKPPAAVAPPWPGRYLKYPPYMNGNDVRQWQGQMAHRGWHLTVDGTYGPQSKDVCTSFQREKGLGVDGIVGPQTWNASWTAPVT